jgi:hypothetical protein
MSGYGLDFEHDCRGLQESPKLAAAMRHSQKSEFGMIGMNRCAPPAAWLALGVLVASCGGDAKAPVAPDRPAVPANNVAASTDPRVTLVAAVPDGVALPLLNIRFDLSAAPVVGQATEVAVTFLVSEPVRRLEIEASSAMLQVEMSTAKQVLEDLLPNSPGQLQWRVTPKVAGLADMELDVRLPDEATVRRARYALPVLNGAAAPDAPSAAD